MSWKMKFGRAFAERVADYLERQTAPSGICNIHRDYCGSGLFFEAGVYKLCIVYDGYPSEPHNKHHPLEFNSREEFVQFLAQQSDFSLSGQDRAQPGLYTKDPFLLNNQRLTQATILEHLNSDSSKA